MVANKYTGSFAPSRWFSPALKHRYGQLAQCIHRASPMRTAVVLPMPPAVRIVPQRASDLKPRIKGFKRGFCLNSTHITNTESTESRINHRGTETQRFRIGGCFNLPLWDKLKQYLLESDGSMAEIGKSWLMFILPPTLPPKYRYFGKLKVGVSQVKFAKPPPGSGTPCLCASVVSLSFKFY